MDDRSRYKKYDRTDHNWRDRTEGNWRKQTERNYRRKQKPTHFIAIQINNQEIIEGLKKVQDCVLKGEPNLQPAVVSLSKLHITLFVFHVENEEELQKAKETLEEAVAKLENLPINSINLEICNISSFNNKVVLAGIKENEGKNKLLDLTEELMSSFENNGFAVREDRPFNPHLTLFKLSKAPQLFRSGIRKIEPRLYEEYSHTQFGLESIKNIQLLSMYGPKDEKGYYHCVSELIFDSEKS